MKKKEAFEQWKLLRYREYDRTDVFVAFDGVDMEHYRKVEFEKYWLEHLDNADDDVLPQADYSSCATLTALKCSGCSLLEIDLSSSLHRVVRIKLKGWKRAAKPVSAGSHKGRCQLNRWSRATAANPVAVRLSRCRLLLYPCGKEIEELIGVENEKL